MRTTLHPAAEKAIHDFSIEAALIVGAPDPLAWAKLTREIARDFVEANPPTERECQLWGIFFGDPWAEMQWEDDGGR